ncbi:MAG: hypothetical protein ACRDP6_44460 [Actinoallomurus sp.]
MSSDFDPRLAHWDQVEVPLCQGARPAVMRTSAPASLADAPLDALLTDITAGLTRSFPQVLPIEARADPRGVPHGSVRLLHAATDPDGEGVTIETLLLKGGAVTCWVAPTARYAAERDVARHAMAGRPAPQREETTRPEPPEGVPVAEARLTVTGQAESDWLAVRRGPTAHARPADGTEPADGIELPASLLPMWLATVTGTAPRPVPARRPMLITTRTALDRLLGLTGPGIADVRTALEAPDLTDPEAAELGALVGGLVRRWTLEWISGRDEAPEDDDASPRLEGRGHLRILDAGPECGLWRVVTDLPELLTAEIPGDQPMGLARTTPSDVWHELTLPIAG